MFEMQGGMVSQNAIFALQDALYSIKNNQCPSSGVIAPLEQYWSFEMHYTAT